MDIFSKIEKERGMVARIYSDFREFSPSVEAHFAMNQALILAPTAPLPRAERELLAYKTSQQNGNEYCASHHKAAYDGFCQESRPDPARSALLEKLASQLTARPAEASALHEVFLDAGFSEAQWQHAVNIVAYFNYTNRLAFAMGMELEDNYQKSCN